MSIKVSPTNASRAAGADATGAGATVEPAAGGSVDVLISILEEVAVIDGGGNPGGHHL